MPELSIILPIYNEEKIIPELIKETKDALVNYSFEIIAVNDGPPDHSYKVLK